MALVVDTSVWIDYFNGQQTRQTERLHHALGQEEVIVGDIILTEILQGFRRDTDFQRARELFRAFPVVSMLGPDMAIKSAENYRALRKRGVTVRKTMDVMIATWCIEHALPLLYSDRDFNPVVQHLGLQTSMKG